MIEDLSFSGIVNKVQHDPAEAKKMIVELALQHEKTLLNIADAERILEGLKGEAAACKVGIQRLVQHMEYTPPIMLISAGVFFDISKDFDITIRRQTI